VTLATAPTGPADVRDARRLASLEETIEAGMASFVAVGEALLEVRDSRLYRLNYPTFEAYCKGRWGFSDRHARRLMDAAEVVAALPTGPIGPVTESQARALVPVLREQGPEAAAAVLTEAIEATNGHVTAAAITAAAYPEETPIDNAMWDSLMAVIDAIEGLAGRDATDIAATVPSRRRAATAKRLRKLGTYLGRIAWTLEGTGEPQA
jgi:hypothetical protein